MVSVNPFHPGGSGREPVPSAEGYTVELFLQLLEMGASSKEQDHTQHGFQEHTPTWTSLLPLGHLEEWGGAPRSSHSLSLPPPPPCQATHPYPSPFLFPCRPSGEKKPSEPKAMPDLNGYQIRV